jgi:hypothetical protein
MSGIQKGSVVRGPAWSEPVEVQLAEQTGKYLRVVGVGMVSDRHIDSLISLEQFGSWPAGKRSRKR